MKIIRIASLLFAIGVLFGLSSCKSTTEPSPESMTLVKPNAGSTYTYKNVTRDSNGVERSSSTSVMRIAATNVTMGGYTDVIFAEETLEDGTKDSNYFRYTSAGDIQPVSLGGSSTIFGGAMIWPFMSHTTQTQTVDSTIVIPFGGTEQEHISLVSKFVRNENFTASGTSLASSTISQTVALLISVPLFGDISTNSTTEISMAPAIGWIVHSKTLNSSSAGQKSDLSESTLMSFSLK